MPWGIDFNPGSSFLGSLLRSILGALQAVFVFIWNTLVAVTRFLLTGLIAVANFLLRMFGHVGRFFQNLWEKWIGKGILKLLELYEKLVAKINKFLEPVIKFIKRIREIIDYWYNKIFGPILNLIQQVRGVLQVFRIFNLKWAKRLDEKLLRLEAKITQPYLILRAKLNEVITWLTLGTDPRLIISRNVLLGSFGKLLNGLNSLLHGVRRRDLTASQELSQERDRTRYSKESIDAHLETLRTKGLTDEDKAIEATMRKAVREVTDLPASDFPAIP